MTHPMPGPVIETERLVLRPPQAEDEDAWIAMMGVEETARFIGGVQAPGAAWRGFACMVGIWALRGYGMFSIIEKSTGRWVGRLGPWYPRDWPGTEIGWGLAREAWGKGYATEGARAAMDFAVDTLGWTDIIHCIEAENTPSIRVAERLGSRHLRNQQAPAPFAHVNWQIWGQSAADWRDRRKV